MLSRYASVAAAADSLGLARETDDLDAAMSRLAQAQPNGMTWQQYIYDIYRRLGMLEQRLTELSKSGQGRTKPALTPLDQVGMDVQTQLGNPPMTSVDTNGSAMQLDVNT